MKISKTAALAAGLLLALPSHSFELPQLALQAFESYFAKADKPSPGQVLSSEPVPTRPNRVGLASANGNFGACLQNFANGTPPAVTQSQLPATRALCFSGFAVLHSGLTKTPVYAAEVLSRDSLEAAKGLKRTNKFFADARLPSTERAALDDYKGSTFQRGHQFAAANANSPEAMAQSFSLSNMVPQSPVNNSKTWAGLEKATRAYAMRASGNVYVITGPVFTKEACPFVLAAKRQLTLNELAIPASNSEAIAMAVKSTGFVAPRNFDAQACTIGAGVVVPSHLFKLVYDASSKRAWAHWLENTDWAKVSRPISYEELVQRTGIEFLPGVQPKS
jgi:endonuclease G